MIICSTNTAPSSLISEISDIANIVIAIISLALAFYIFVYQRDKDSKDKREALNLQEQSIRLQWFKELIIQPHLVEIETFYSHLHSIESRFTPAGITDEQKIEVINFIKDERSKVRKTFGDILINVNPELYNHIKTNLDNLIDKITNIIFDDGLNLHHKPTFDKEIGSLISYSHNDLISKIYNYKG